MGPAGIFNPPPIPVGGGLFAGANPFGAPNPGGRGRAPNIVKIEKVRNCVVYEKFIGEFKRMMRKYPNKKVTDIMKHLFHGCKQTDPKLIYSSEDGLDIRFANAGAFGTGIYFANNSCYSHNYAHPLGNGSF